MTNSPAVDGGRLNGDNENPDTTLTEHEKQIEKKLVWKLDLIILPLVCLTFFLSCIDRTNYAAARLQHLEKDLKMTDAQYQTALCIYYLGYIFLQVPSNLLLNHYGRPALHIGLSTIAWGIVTTCTARVHNFQGMLACRIILGIVGQCLGSFTHRYVYCFLALISLFVGVNVEAPVYPGILFYLTRWYKKTELTLRISIYLAAGLVAAAFGSLIAAGILSGLDGVRGLSAWQWLYIIEGAVSISGGIAIISCLPNFPHTWTALAPEMKQVAIRRLTLDALQADLDISGGMSQVQGLKLALADIKLYVMAAINMCIIGAIGCQNFFPTLTATLGYSHIVSLLLVAPPYMFIAFYSCLHSYLSDKVGNRFWFIMYPAPIAIAGFVIFMTVDTFGVKYFSTFLMLLIYPMNNTISAWIATCISRPPAKRAAAYGFISTVANSANIWTPFTYRNQDAPHFRLALGIVTGLVFAAAVLSIVLRMMLVRENRKLDGIEIEDSHMTEVELARLEKTAEAEGIDMATTKRLHHGFRYTI
ncbi:hypothetical protein ARAM_001987 [Aspergillus rambellii]|uniref:Major facilitator superfamily (MFS) profile domain-containing protein n=1 Tax=Aspergillus rambellii TaxID=308745 RepID=A0A0F8UR87_9EURO|nr:hypothetical protein ARAM_001987 [Aspergillus rambellii]